MDDQTMEPILSGMDSGYVSSAASILSDGNVYDPTFLNHNFIGEQTSTSDSNIALETVALETVPDIVDLLADEDPTVVKEAAKVICSLICDPDKGCRRIILLSDGMHHLVRLLATTKDCEVLNHALLSIHNLILHQEGAKEVFFQADGLDALIHFVQTHQDDKKLCVAIDCIRLLAYKNQPVRMAILNSSTTARLVQILEQSQFVELKRIIIRVLKVLSACPQNSKVIVDCGGFHYLASILNASIDDTGALWTLRNLSDDAINLNGLEPLLHSLIGILELFLAIPVSEMTPSSENHTISEICDTLTCATQILSNLTCNVSNKTYVQNINGVEALIKIAHCFAGDERITDSALCSIRHLSWGYPNAEIAQQTIIGMGLLPLILNNFLHTRDFSIRKAVVGIIRNLAANSTIVPTLIEFDVKQALIDQFVRGLITTDSPSNEKCQNLVLQIEQTIELINNNATVVMD
ncbi:junction plakoglobin-like [Brevipalpus obovatus]|uniref:junction plakoglobin-like n=1 Tax=Brevipalpus obovatus TaxID=246614 RepID=UPI003D9E0BB4